MEAYILRGFTLEMNLHQWLMRHLGGIARSRAWALLLLATAGTLLPASAFAIEGEDIHLVFTQNDQILLGISLALGLLALLYGWYLARGVLKESPGPESMQEVGAAIKEGALAYLKRQVMTMAIFVFVIALLLFLMFYFRDTGPWVALGVAITFIAGVAASYIAGYSGMVMAVNANTRTANAALTSYKRSLEIAFRSGAVAGMVTVGMGLIGAGLILLLAPGSAVVLLVGFGFGGSLAALFMRVGGGIFTKAADVGADLVGKVEAGIPEDDPRNPATIADNVGDNVGDCAGMAADIFESYEVTLVAAIVLGAATAAIFDQATWTRLILFALMARGVGIIASMIGIGLLRGTDDLDADPLRPIRKGFYTSAIVAVAATAALAFVMMGGLGGDSLIRTSQLRSGLESLRHDMQLVQQVQREQAAQRNVQPYQVTVPEVVADPRIQALGFQDRPQDTQFLQQMLEIREEQFPAPREMLGFERIVDFTATNRYPQLGYALIGYRGADPGQATFGSVFQQQDLRVVQLRQVQVRPAQPAADDRPAVPEERTESVVWIGPAPETQLDQDIENQVQMARTQGVEVEFQKLQSLPVDLYASRHDDRVAIAVRGEVDRPYLLPITDQFSYIPATREQVQQAMTAAQAGEEFALPPTRQPEVAIVLSRIVPWWTFFLAIAFGVVMAFLIEYITDYYVSTHKKPTQEVAGVSTAGPAPMIIQGFAYAAESSVFMVFSIVFALLFPLFIFPPAAFDGSYILSFYGIALVGLGLLTTTAYVLAMDTFGPISDNAQGVFEMSGAGHDNEAGSKAVQRLDAAGNTTKALTKGFAIATAVVAAVALFHSFIEGAQLHAIGLRLDIPEIFLGLLIGGAAPYLFSAFSINAVGRASFELINEVRRQFREDPGIMAGTSKPDYARCVAIVTRAAQKELLSPGVLAIALPVAVGFGFSIGKEPQLIGGQYFNLTGAQALGGYLAGAILSGQLMAVLLANSGGMWDNAKKLIEDGLYGGKGSEAHKAGVVCDTVGDPFKDTAGPALNPLIKVMNLVALLIAGWVVTPLSQPVLITITLVAVGLLVFSIVLSKRGSMSSAMMKAQEAGEKADEVLSNPELRTGPGGATTVKKRITVEEEPLQPPIDDEPKA
jgi:K(+)-stimulated pyrophosphate-energized sodium pump